MGQEELRESLEHLRAEIEEADLSQGEARAQLEALVVDIERRLEAPEDHSQHETLVANLKDAFDRFKTEHPRATAILNRVLVSLGEVGI